MGYTKEDILQYIDEEDVKFIRLAFCDPYGHQKNISIMPGALEKAFDEGIEIDGEGVFNKSGKLLLIPDPDTISVLPWRPSHGRVVRMFCNLKTKKYEAYPYDTRKLLMDACNKLDELKKSINIQIKYDFYLFKLDEEGNPTKTPYDYAGYMDIAPDDKGENVRREICLSLTEMEINPVGSHHEMGPGQNRIYFEPATPVNAADDAVTFVSVVKTISARNGLFADFGVKPLEGYEANKCLIEISSSNNDIEELYANLQSNYKELELFVCPTDEAYFDNAKIYLEDNKIVVEATSNMNPYIAYSLLINGMLEKGTNTTFNLNLKEAKKNAQDSAFVNKYINKELLEYYLAK